jgi:parallel beta-helix repeat protein
MEKTAMIFLFIFSVSFSLLAQKDVQKAIQTQFIMAEDGDTIHLDKGYIYLDGTLWMDGKSNILIKGKGMNETVLVFKGQSSGAEGIKVTNSKDIIIEGLTVLDAKGDAIKVQQTNGITFRAVKTAWSGKPKSSNGAYGFYPVNCERVLIEYCEAMGASDAGIYVGQSKCIIVRNSKAYQNVAGIEIENSLYAEVYDNEAFENTGGLLVFDLPDLVLKKGGHVKLYNNKVYNNNLKNFAPKGNIVAKVPDGTGLLILATNNVEAYNNEFINNQTANAGIISYYMTEEPIKDSLYYPFPNNIYLHDNLFERKRTRATMNGRMGKLYRFKLRFGKDVPHIMFDGILDEKQALELCLENNTNESFINLDAANDFKNMSRDMSRYKCSMKKPDMPASCEL